MASKSKFFRAFTEGDSTDGRVIQRSWIEQMAKNFSQAKYGARVWLEHMRGLLPDSPFKAYGDVTAVKAEEVDVDGVKKLALFVQIDPTADLIAMNKARQKIYTSVEIDPNFAKTGECYLVGLAVTDSPASLGTEMLAFAAGATTNPLAERKQKPENLFTAAQEVAFEFEEIEQTSVGDSLFTKVKTLLGMDKKDADSRFADVGQAVEAVALSQKDTLNAFTKIQKEMAELSAAVKLSADTLAASKQEFTDLKAALDQEPAGSKPRQTATGASGNEKTDC